MREKIERFAKGIFTYEKPELLLSEESLSLKAEAGSIVRGSFCVSSSGKKAFKGIITSNDSRFIPEKDTFFSAQNEIFFNFDATYLDPGDYVRSEICVISEFGEKILPIFVKVINPVCCIEDTKISDLFTYTNLAKTDPEAARKLFVSPSFDRMLKYYEPDSYELYKVLKASPDIARAMEEFLIAVHKKKRVSVSTEPGKLIYEQVSDDISGSVRLHKDSWGYSELLAFNEGDFIELEEKVIPDSAFKDDIATLNFKIKYASLHAGQNSGRIILTYPGGRVRIEIEAQRKSLATGEADVRLRIKHLLIKITDDYMSYRTGLLSKPGFVSEEETNLANLISLKNETLVEQLAKIYLLIVSDKLTQADNQLSVIEEDEDWDDYPIEVYAAAVYLRALISGTDREPVILRDRLQDIYRKSGNPYIYIMYMHLDTRKRVSNHMKYEELRRACEGSAPSRLALYEAVNLINEEPAVMKGFAGFDLQCVYFGLKYGILTHNAVLQAGYLAIREKKTNAFLIRVLGLAFEKNKINEILEPYCMHLIAYRNATGKNVSCYDAKTYELFTVAVIEQLRIRDLYEHCLMSAGDGFLAPLPKELINFLDDSSKLSDDARTALYANVIFYHKPEDEPLSRMLLADIKEFAERKLMEGAVSTGLQVIYNFILDPDNMSERVKEALVKLAFKYRVTVGNMQAEYVLVVHKELKTAKKYRLDNKVAYVDIATGSGVVVPVDAHGNALSNSRMVSERIFTRKDLLKAACEASGDDPRVLLYLYERVEEEGVDDSNVEILRKLITLDDVEESFADGCRLELIDYFYDNLEGEIMESYLVQLKLETLSSKDRAHAINLMITRELYSLAMKNMELYGFTHVDVKRLSKVVSRLIESEEGLEKNKVFIAICCHVLSRRRHTGQIVEFLAEHYFGSLESMYEVWSIAVGFGFDTTEIEERILETILFTESELSFAKEVFRHYYGHAAPGKLIRACVSYYAYEYLAFDRDPSDEIYELIRKETEYDENEVCVLAVLKYYSTRTKLSDDEIRFSEYQLTRLERKGIVFPFFKDFAKSVRIPKNVEDKFYVEYHTEPGRKVRIHYSLIGPKEQNFVEEDMRDLGYGIFIKELVLFYGEILQYYISEEDDEGGRITESAQVYLEPDVLESDESSYRRLNLIVTAKELKDTKTMQKLLESYVRNDYLCRHLFKPML